MSSAVKTSRSTAERVIGHWIDGRGARAQARHERLCSVFTDCDSNRDRHASLTGRTVSCADDRFGGSVKICVRHRNRMVLGATERLHSLTVRNAMRLDVARHRRRADKAHSGHVGMVKQRVHGYFIALYDVESALWRVVSPDAPFVDMGPLGHRRCTEPGARLHRRRRP